MNGPCFDALTRVLAHPLSRRALVPLLCGVLAEPFFVIAPAQAKKKKTKKKKTTLCLDGQTIQAAKKKKKTLIKRGATLGACPPVCTPQCPGTVCGGTDGCGGTCGCATGFVCHAGVCQACDVTCTGDGAACGNDLKAFLNGGGTVVACPGRYVGNFALNAPNITLIGAGQGEDPATNTILDANGAGRVMNVLAGVNAVLSGIRLTGGLEPAGNGAGIFNSGTLAMTACTIDKNSAGGAGGGLVQTGSLTLNDCVVSGNTAVGPGGGIFSTAGATSTIHGSAISGNEAQLGGGFFNQDTATFDSASSITGNMASLDGGGIFSNGGAVTLNGANVSGNTPNNCVDVMGC